jgi:hypothetical protein
MRAKRVCRSQVRDGEFLASILSGREIAKRTFGTSERPAPEPSRRLAV